jgi:hypothetical protein
MNRAGCLLALASVVASIALSCSSTRTGAPSGGPSQVKAQPVIPDEVESAKEGELEARTVDQVIPGFQQNERDHNLQAEKSSAMSFFNHRFRLINPDGWFSCDLKALPGEPQELSVSFGARRRSGGTCDVFVNDEKIATVCPQITDPTGPSYGAYDRTYPISPDMIQGKDQITVKFQAGSESVITVVGIELLKPGKN